MTPVTWAEIGVYHDDRFVCRAVSPELAAQTISLQELQATRSARRRALATQLAGRREHAEQLLTAAPYPDDRVDPALTARGEQVSTATPATRPAEFLITNEHRRFTEFADAVRQQRYIRTARRR
jgi:hypothetical protein